MSERRLPAGSGWMAGYRERQFDFRLRVSVGSPYRVVATGEVESGQRQRIGLHCHRGAGSAIDIRGQLRG